MKLLNDIFAHLNDRQREAVENIDGPMMVVAGPGTGKTHVLSARIAKILTATDTPPHSILVLTFTDSAAKNMRERIVNIIGKEGYYLEISTFHSFCSTVIKMYPEYFPIERGSTPLSDLERISYFEDIINRVNIQSLKPINSPGFYLKDIISVISQLKKESIMPSDFRKIIVKEFSIIDEKLPVMEKRKILRNKEKNEELSVIYDEYQKDLRKNKKYDFDDMISLVVDAFKKNELLLRTYQERLHYFLVDEYQDTNTSQNIVVDLLASYWGDAANICVVGDPHQSIYRFQGASIENSIEFIRKYPKTRVVTLTEGYRCPQNIYHASHELIMNNTLTSQNEKLSNFIDAISNTITSHNKKNSLVSLKKSPSQVVEIITLADQIKRMINDGIDPSTIAVLYRNNNDAHEVQEIFDKWGIPYEIDGGENILISDHIFQLINFMNLIGQIRSSHEDRILFEVMSYDWIEVDKLLVIKAGRAAGKAKISLYDLIQKGYETFMNYDIGPSISQLEFHQLEVFVNRLNEWTIQEQQTVFTEWFEIIIRESGYLKWILQQDTRTEMLIELNSLFREIKSMLKQDHNIKLKDFIEKIQLMQENGIQITAEDMNIKKGAVHLSTVHRAKGREWDYVFIIHCIDRKWGNSQKRDLISLPLGILTNTDLSKKERNEDERRLFYVALTRARKYLFISYPETIISDNRSKNVVPSMFIQEIISFCSRENNATPQTELIDGYIQKLMAPAHKRQSSLHEREYFFSLIKNFKLSSTALNTYLRNKKDFVENIILRIPRAKPEVMAFGTAIHSALEKMYTLKMNDEKLNLDKIIYEFEVSLKKELITEENLDRRLKLGKKVLTDYFALYSQEKVEVLYVERFFGYGFSKAILNDIPLTGRIDRIDWIDKRNNTVRVIDYKTGSVKSLNEIEGRTLSSGLSEEELLLPEEIRGPYKRQLVFYKLLTELDKSFSPKVEEGMFDFIEPNKQTGKLVRRKLMITDHDVTLLKELIKKTFEEIRKLKFLEDYSTKSLSFRARVG